MSPAFSGAWHPLRCPDTTTTMNSDCRWRARRKRLRSCYTTANGAFPWGARPARTYSNCRLDWWATCAPTWPRRWKTSGFACNCCVHSACPWQTRPSVGSKISAPWWSSVSTGDCPRMAPGGSACRRKTFAKCSACLLRASTKVMAGRESCRSWICCVSQPNPATARLSSGRRSCSGSSPQQTDTRRTSACTSSHKADSA